MERGGFGGGGREGGRTLTHLWNSSLLQSMTDTRTATGSSYKISKELLQQGTKEHSDVSCMMPEAIRRAESMSVLPGLHLSYVTSYIVPRIAECISLVRALLSLEIQNSLHFHDYPENHALG